MPTGDPLKTNYDSDLAARLNAEGQRLAEAASGNLVVSVESRKGGVGKTTAALNLGRLLLKPRKTAVLLIDADITGTSAADGLDSLYWKQTTHLVETSELDGNKRANLLELFDKGYMTGAGVPTFTLHRPTDFKSTLSFDPEKLNVLGSQLYVRSTEEGKNSVTCVCDPGVLFDDLHAYWFVEFLQRVCESFRDAVGQHDSGTDVAIVVDNSPGFIGIAPSIQDWLTDLGPQRGKFLFVTSLDPQDLRSSTLAVEALHEKLSVRVQAAAEFRNLLGPTPNEPIHLNPPSETFLEQLAESAWSKDEDPSLQRPGLAVFAPDLSFYIAGTEELQERFLKHPTSYMAMIVNRVPKKIARRQLRNNLELRLHEIHRESKTIEPLVIDQLLRVPGEGRFKTLVYYDDAIEYQFLDQSNQSHDDRLERRRRGLTNALKRRATRADSTLADDPTQGLIRPGNADTYPMMDRISSYVSRAQTVVTEMLGLFDAYGAGYLARLVRDEWQPAFSFRRLRDAINDMLDDFDLAANLTHIDEQETRRHRSESNDIFLNLRTSLARNVSASDVSSHEHTAMFTPSMAAAIVLAMEESPKPQAHMIVEFLAERLAALAAQQARAWLRWGKVMGGDIPSFLMAHGRSLTTQGEQPHPHYDDQTSRLAQEVSFAQARLLDLRNDVLFMMRLLCDAAQIGEMPDEPSVPNMRDIADQVILDKTLPHSQASEVTREALRSEQHMREFSEVLRLVLAGWERLK